MSEISATRDAFGKALITAGHENENVVVVSCDLSGATKAKGFQNVFPDRYFEVGISEQDGITVSSALGMDGLRPFISSFASFITQRGYDQIMNSAGYNNAPIVIVGSHSGLGIGKDGATQMGIADINVMRGIPNMNIYQPADSIETEQIVKYLSNNNELAYLRISRTPQECVLPEDFVFTKDPYEIHKGDENDNNLVIFATGDMVYKTLKSVTSLEKKGISCSVVNISTLKPISSEKILSFVEGKSGVITIEDHSIIGGLGSIIANILAISGIGVKLKQIGINDCYGESGAPEELYKKHQLDHKSIEDTINMFSQSV